MLMWKLRKQEDAASCELRKALAEELENLISE